MIIVADSGSTKTDWVVIAKHQEIDFSSKGINPLFLDKDDVNTRQEFYDFVRIKCLPKY